MSRSHPLRHERWQHARAAALLALIGAVASTSASALPRVFIETDVGARNPYVQAATRVTIRVYSARALYHPDLDLPGTTDVLVRQVGNDDHGSAEREGRSYDVLTRQYLVFPQHSGKITLPGAELSAQVLTSNGRPDPFRSSQGGGGFGGSPYPYGAMSIAVEPLQLKGDPILLEVRPRPAGALASYWMPAREVTLTSSWQPQSLRAHVGDALTLDVTLQADGLTAEQLPDLTTLMALPPGLKVYPEEPKLDNFNQADTVVGRRQQSIALIADRPGEFTLPALRITWWDTVRDIPQQVLLPPRSIEISAVPAGQLAGAARSHGAGEAPLAGPVSGAARDPWRWATLVLAVAWLGTLAAWYGIPRRGLSAATRGTEEPPVMAPGASRARAAFLEACTRHDARAARRHLLAWAAAQWPRSPPRGLNSLAKRIDDEEIGRLLRELDRACFAGGDWRGELLAHAFASWPAARAVLEGHSGTGGRSSPLAPLYH